MNMRHYSPTRRRVRLEDKEWQRKGGHNKASFIQKREVTLQEELDMEEKIIANMERTIKDKVVNV